MLSKLGNKVRSGVTQRRTGVTVLAGSLAVLAVWMIAGQVPVGAANTLGTIKGFGGAGFISKFLDNYTIVSSGIFENQGNVGIGTTNPQAKLDVLGSIRIDGAGNGLTFADGSSVYNRASLIGPQGPQGLQGAPGINGTNGTNGTNGAPGPPGPSGVSHAWIDRATSVALGTTDTTVAQVIVPAGTYLIFGKVAVENTDTSISAIFDCNLDTGDKTEIFLDNANNPVRKGAISVQDSVTFSATSAITMTCKVGTASTGTASNVALTAIAVDALN